MARDLGESSKALTRRVPVSTRAVGGAEGLVAATVLSAAGTGVLELAHVIPAHLSTVGTDAGFGAAAGAVIGIAAAPHVVKATKAVAAQAKKALHL